MTYEDIRTKCEAWRAENPFTNLRVPDPHTVESFRSTFGDEVLERLGDSIDEQIRIERKALARAAQGEA